jgi:hypothetical protein
MPFLGLIDWIVISLFGLVIGFGLVCLGLMILHESVSFKPKTNYRPSTHFVDETGQHCYIEAPRIYDEHCWMREQNRKWYHRLVVGP